MSCRGRAGFESQICPWVSTSLSCPADALLKIWTRSPALGLVLSPANCAGSSACSHPSSFPLCCQRLVCPSQKSVYWEFFSFFEDVWLNSWSVGLQNCHVCIRIGMNEFSSVNQMAIPPEPTELHKTNCFILTVMVVVQGGVPGFFVFPLVVLRTECHGSVEFTRHTYLTDGMSKDFIPCRLCGPFANSQLDVVERCLHNQKEKEIKKHCRRWSPEREWLHRGQPASSVC